MRELSPQERIDLIDLVRYAFKKKYIKRYTSLKMDEPVRKIVQRILSKMFPTCSIVKSRGSNSYNISFNKKMLYHGDSPYHRWRNESTLSIHSIDQYSEILKTLDPRHLDNKILKILMLIHDSGVLKEFAGNYWGGHDELAKKIHGTFKDGLLAQAEAAYSNKTMEETRQILRDLLSFCEAFCKLSDTDIQDTTTDPELRDLVNVRNILVKQNYGFSIIYNNLNNSWRWRNRINSDDKAPLVRRFKPGSPILTKLEELSKAAEIFDILSRELNKNKALLDLFRLIYQELNRSYFRLDYANAKARTMSEDGGLPLIYNYVSKASEPQKLSDFITYCILKFIGYHKEDEELIERLKTYFKEAKEYYKIQQDERQAELNTVRVTLNSSTASTYSTNTTGNVTFTWSDLTTSGNDGGNIGGTST